MSVVVEIAGSQYQVKNGDTLTVAKLEGNPGDQVEFTNILLSGEGEDAKIGTPYIEGAVKAEIVEHGRGEKVWVFHKKRRKGYRKLNGHKAWYTQIKITDVNA